MKYVSMSILALLLFGGCATKPEPKPQPPVVVAVVEKPKPVVYHQAPVKKGVVPPLPKREVDIDVDSAVDSAMGD